MLPPKIKPMLELTVGDYEGFGASIDYGRDGARFDLTIGPVGDDMIAALGDVAVQRGRICLHCRGTPVFVDVVSAEREHPDRVRLGGLIVKAPRSATTFWGAPKGDDGPPILPLLDGLNGRAETGERKGPSVARNSSLRMLLKRS